MLACGLPQLLSSPTVRFRPPARIPEGLLIVLLFIALLIPIMAVAHTFRPHTPLPPQVALDDASWPHWGAPPFAP